MIKIIILIYLSVSPSLLYWVSPLICIYSEMAQNKTHSFLLGGLKFLGDIKEKHTFTEE